MEWLVLGRSVTCDLDGSATYDCCAAVCYLFGTDLAETLVRQGFARDCPRYSCGRHHHAELQAAQRGATIGEAYKPPGYCIGR
jgi:micrococcal nuclease